MTPELIDRIEQAVRSRVTEAQLLSVGFGLMGVRVKLADKREAAVKAVSPPGLLEEKRPEGHCPSLALEGYMLRELRRCTRLPVPDVYHACSDLLIMQWIENEGGPIEPSAERHAAELLAEMHALRFPQFGYERDTLIGPLHQPNPLREKWIPFFRDHRLLHMAALAHKDGRLSAPQMERLNRLAERLDQWLIEPPHPSLIHGDVWSGNVLVKGGRIAGFVDPAIYCAHPEVELAFSTMFNTFGAPFFDAYHALRPIEPEFREIRCQIYNIYPALVHIRLFGAGYWPKIDSALKSVGL